MLTNRIDFWLILILKSSDISSNIKIIQNYFNLKLILNFEIKNLKIYLKLIMNFKSIFQRKPNKPSLQNHLNQTVRHQSIVAHRCNLRSTKQRVKVFII